MAKIFVILPNGAKGGAERVLTGLAQNLHEQGENCTLIYLSDEQLPGFTYTGKAEVKKGSFLKNLIIYLPLRLAKLSKNDVVISSQFYINVWVGLLKCIGICRSKTAARESTRIFIRFGGWRRWFAAMAVRLFYGQHDVIVAQTKAMAQDITSLKKKVNVLHLPNPFEPPQKSHEVDLPMSWKNVPLIVAAGRLIPIKRFDLLIKAFAPLSSEAKLLILGEGPERANLEALILSSQLTDKVLLKGEVQEPSAYFELASCCVVSSELEGFPNVLLEMMHANGAVVSTLCADGIVDLPGLITCEPNQEGSLYKAMLLALKLGESSKNQNKRRMYEVLNERNYTNYWYNLSLSLGIKASNVNKVGV